MDKHLSILIVEDSESDAALIIRHFRKEGYTTDYRRVEIASEMRAALESGSWDLVIADYSLPQFDAPGALAIFREYGLDIPFIVVSGTVGEETAVAMMKTGAHDYIMKQHLARLVPASERELLEAEIRRAKRQAEKEVKQAAEEWANTFNSIRDLVSVHDRDYRFVRVNKAYADTFKMSPDEFTGRYCYEVVHGTDRPIEKCPHARTILEGKATTDELFEPHLGVYLEVSTSPVFDQDGATTGSVHIAKDITARKRSEDAVKASLKEKEVLLKEIHHRVKNNLQLISSLFSLQSRFEGDGRVHDVFKESIDRVKAIASIHAMLYQSTDYSRIDFGRFIDDLMSRLSVSHHINRERIVCRSDIGEFYLDVNTAVPCGLALNELISNAMKHAFPQEGEGEIVIATHSEDDSVVLTVSDNGVGFPDNINFRDTESLGLQLVVGLVEQLDGTIDLDGLGGTTFRITFKAEE